MLQKNSPTNAMIEVNGILSKTETIFFLAHIDDSDADKFNAYTCVKTEI